MGRDKDEPKKVKATIRETDRKKQDEIRQKKIDKLVEFFGEQALDLKNLKSEKLELLIFILFEFEEIYGSFLASNADGKYKGTYKTVIKTFPERFSPLWEYAGWVYKESEELFLEWDTDFWISIFSKLLDPDLFRDWQDTDYYVSIFLGLLFPDKFGSKCPIDILGEGKDQEKEFPPRSIMAISPIDFWYILKVFVFYYRYLEELAPYAITSRMDIAMMLLIHDAFVYMRSYDEKGNHSDRTSRANEGKKEKFKEKAETIRQEYISWLNTHQEHRKLKVSFTKFGIAKEIKETLSEKKGFERISLVKIVEVMQKHHEVDGTKPPWPFIEKRSSESFQI